MITINYNFITTVWVIFLIVQDGYTVRSHDLTGQGQFDSKKKYKQNSYRGKKILIYSSNVCTTLEFLILPSLFFRNVYFFFSFIYLVCTFAVSYYNKNNGKTIALWKGYSFCLHVKGMTSCRWRCSSSSICSRNCKSFFNVSKNGKLIRSNPDHNHPPPKFFINNGVYYKI